MNTKPLVLSLIATLACAAASIAQETPPAPPTQPAPTTPTPAPSPAAEPKPEEQPPAPATADSTTPPEAQAQASQPFADADAVEKWMQTYYLHPEPNRVVEAFQTLARTKSIGVNADHTWAQTAFFWACMRENAASMAEWCATVGHLDEPAKTWWWTAVWMSQTIAGNEAIAAAASLPEGHADKIKFSWLNQKPQDILQTSFRGNGRQHIEMLWYAFAATGNEAMIYKMFEGFVPPEPKEPQNQMQAQIADRRRAKNKEIIENTRKGFAENLPKFPKALQICKDSIPKLKDPVKSEITKLVADAEATASGHAPTPPAESTPTPKAETPSNPDSALTPAPESTPQSEPKSEPKPEPKKEEPKQEEPKPEPKSDPK